MTIIHHEARRSGLRFRIFATRDGNPVTPPLTLRFWRRSQAELVASALNLAYRAGAKDHS